MPRTLTWMLGPETVLGLISAIVFWYCGRHNTGEGRDLELLERLVMMLPFILVPLVFVTVAVPGAKNWWWLGRAVFWTLLGLVICSGKIIGGFGTGAKGQDAAFILVLVFGVVLVAIGTSLCGTIVLAAEKPHFADWFRARWLLGGILALLAAVPIGLVLGVTVTVIIGIGAGFWSAFQR